MPISYLDPNSKKIIREPLVKRFRSFYRSPRKSGQENLFNQKVYMDMNRLMKKTRKKMKMTKKKFY